MIYKAVILKADLHYSSLLLRNLLGQGKCVPYNQSSL